MTTKELREIITGLFQDRIDWLDQDWDEDSQRDSIKMSKALAYFEQCKIVPPGARPATPEDIKRIFPNVVARTVEHGWIYFPDEKTFELNKHRLQRLNIDTMMWEGPEI